MSDRRVVSDAELNRATLARQLLLHRIELDPVTAISRLFALQAQEPASPYLALWTRVTGFDPVTLDDAFATGQVVKATLMRMTLHAVAAEDYPIFWSALADYALRARSLDRRFAPTGNSDGDVRQLTERMLPLMDRPRSNAAMAALLDELAGPAPDPGWWWAVRAYAPLLHAPTADPWSFGRRPSYVAATPQPIRLGQSAEDALDHVVRRYLAAFGPAALVDIAEFTKLARSAARAVVERLHPELTQFRGSNGQELIDVPGAVIPPDDTPAPARFLPMWDSVLLAYADRSRIIPPDVRMHVIRRNGDVLPTILVDGYVAGVWFPRRDNGRTGIRIKAFCPLPPQAWDELEAEAANLVAFLDQREPEVYRRYTRWWDVVPAPESRTLPD